VTIAGAGVSEDDSARKDKRVKALGYLHDTPRLTLFSRNPFPILPDSENYPMFYHVPPPDKV
jgi:hypothetical protein